MNGSTASGRRRRSARFLIRFLIAVLLAGALFVVPRARPALACSCLPLSEAQHFDIAHVVFTGTALAFRDPNAGATLRSSTEPVYYRFAVHSVVKGEPTERVEVRTARGGATCGAGFVLGERYVVYARRDDGNQLTTSLCSGNRARPAAVTAAAAPAPSARGYWLVSAAGGVLPAGEAPLAGMPAEAHLAAPTVTIAAHLGGEGYRVASADGGVFAFGDAPFLGSMARQHLNAPVVAIVASPSGSAYALIASDRGVFSFGDALYAQPTSP